MVFLGEDNVTSISMCGILGYVGVGLPPNLFAESLNRLAHRGPDGSGIWIDEGIMLGHRRLSIIDLSDGGAQPMCILDRYAIVFNGEIYNYRELRSQLEKYKYHFKGNSDTEVLLYSYVHWGEECLSKLNGMWSFAIWDKQEKKLLLSRDRVGKKPLFYSVTKNGFFFASEMKALYPVLSDVQIDYENLDFAIKNNFLYEASERCLIKDIQRFPAGSFGVFKEGKLTIEKFWNPLQQKIAVPRKYNDQVEYFRELFIDSCRLRMRSDVTIGTALSGGLDSSAVICTMNHISRQSNMDVDWQHAFVATFPGTPLDESEYAKSVTDHIGIKADFIEIDPVKELNNLFFQAYMFEEIYYAPTIPFVQLYRSMSEKNVKVSIDGHGADELFAGYGFDMDAALIDALPDILEFKNIADTISDSYESAGRNYQNKLKYALLNKYPILRQFSKKPVLQKKYKQFDFLNSRLFDSTYFTVLPTLLRNYDRYSMMNGVEIRMPFLDYRILQFAFSIPYNSKMRRGYAKAVIRDALHGIIPEKVRKRKSKLGFNSPMNAWIKRKEFKEWLCDEMESSAFRTATTINPIEVKKSLLHVLKNDGSSFSNASNLFEKFIPYLWEKGLKLYAR